MMPLLAVMGTLAMTGCLPIAAVFRGSGPQANPERVAGVENRFNKELETPLVLEWSKGLPRKDPMALAQLEMSPPVLAGRDRVAVGVSRWPALFLVDRQDGEIVARVPTQGPVQSRVTVEGEHLYFADTSGFVYSTDLMGAKVWTQGVGSSVYGAVAVAGDRVIVQTAADQLLALARDTGEILWTWAHEAEGRDELDILGTASPVIHEGRVYVGLSDGSAAQIDLGTGLSQAVASVSVGRFQDIDATPVIAAGNLILGSFSGPLVALSIPGLEEKWRISLGIAAALTVQDDVLYASVADGSVRAFRPADGTEMWRWPVSSPTLGSALTASQGGGTALVQEQAPVSSGLIDLQWPRTSGQQYTQPVVTGSYLLAGADHGTLNVLDRYDGSLKWQFKPHGWLDGIAAAPLIVGRQVLIMSNAGTLHSLVGARLPEDLTSEPSRRLSRAVGW